MRVFFGQRAASTYSSDFSRAGLDRMVKSALELAKITSEDPFGGIPEADQLGSIKGDLDLYSRGRVLASRRRAHRLRAARGKSRARLLIRASRTPKADRSTPPPDTKFWPTRTDSLASIAAPIAPSRPFPLRKTEAGAMQRDYWFSVARTLKKLDAPEQVGKIAAQRTLAPPGRAQSQRPRKSRSSSIPMVATSILEHIFEGVNGDSVYRGASFLAGKLGQKIAGDNVTIIDDGTMPGGFGTSPFDGEGIPTRRTVVIENGVLKSYLLNTYTAKKLGLKTTGNASRGLGRHSRHRPGKLLPAARSKTPKELIAGIKEGLYVTEFLGHGVNLVTGDYSRGASGLWISDGELTYPVEEITVAGNLKDLFFNISEIASDLEFRGSVAAPTIRIDGLMVGGE